MRSELRAASLERWAADGERAAGAKAGAARDEGAVRAESERASELPSDSL